MTQWDIKIELSEIQGFVPGENVESPIALVSRKVRLAMTVDYAKVFAKTLMVQIAKHEAIKQEASKTRPSKTQTAKRTKISSR